MCGGRQTGARLPRTLAQHQEPSPGSASAIRAWHGSQERQNPMNKTTTTAIAAAVGLAFVTFAAAGDMSKPDYTAAKERIKSEYRTAKAACDPLKGNAQDV